MIIEKEISDALKSLLEQFKETVASPLELAAFVSGFRSGELARSHPEVRSEFVAAINEQIQACNAPAGLLLTP